MIDKYRPQPETLAKQNTWGTPAPGTFIEQRHKFLLPNDELLHVRWEFDERDRYLGFALVHMAEGFNGEDEKVVSVDTRHGEVHLHQYRRGNVRIDRKILRIITAREDLDIGYEMAFDEVTEKWEEHKRRWNRGR